MAWPARLVPDPLAWSPWPWPARLVAGVCVCVALVPGVCDPGHKPARPGAGRLVRVTWCAIRRPGGQVSVAWCLVRDPWPGGRDPWAVVPGPWAVVPGGMRPGVKASAHQLRPPTPGPKKRAGRRLRGFRPDFTRYVPRETVSDPREEKEAPLSTLSTRVKICAYPKRNGPHEPDP